MAINPITLEAYANQMHKVGLPKDQARNFLVTGYISLPWAMQFHLLARQMDNNDAPVHVLLGGARGPGKSHAIMAQIGLDDCQRFDGLKWLFLRKAKYKAQESFDDLVRKVFRGAKHDYKQGQVTFENESRILIGGFQNENDIDDYTGIEYDGIAIEELTQLTWKKVDMLLGSLRTSRTDWRQRLYTSSNPGGIGHNDVKREFILPFRENSQTRTCFIPSTYRDNPLLSQEYIDYLEQLKGPLGQAWRDGDWDVFEGMAFPTWEQQLHVVKPFPIPDNWLKWRGIDWGYAAPWCTLWLAKDPATTRIFVYREAYQSYLTDKQQAQRILDLTPKDENIAYTYADPSMWASKTADDTVTSTETAYQHLGVYLTKADNSRILGKRKLDDLLALRPDGKPGIQFFSTCANTIRTVQALPVDETHPEDVDTDAEDHCFIAGTMVETEAGEKPIETVHIGDKVLTRTGYKKVISSGYTGTRLCHDVTLTCGKHLIGTPNHPIFVNRKGFIRIDTLKYGDILYTKKECEKWLSYYLPRSKNLKENAIIFAVDTFKEKAYGYTLKFGKRIMDKFQKATMCITRMEIDHIIRKITLNFYPIVCTYRNIASSTYQAQSIWQPYAHSQQSGIVHRKGTNGTRNTGKIAGRIENRWKELAINVVRNILPWIEKRLASARMRADQSTDAKAAKITLSVNVNTAANPLSIINTANRSVVQESVPGDCAVKKIEYYGYAKVYNLTVSDQQEYFANGVLVHNCYDALRYALTNVDVAAEPKKKAKPQANPWTTMKGI
jgi:phage terminase large subunit